MGNGSTTSRALIIGEAPGANEDELGMPFVGKAGELLDSTLEAAGLAREQIYVTNVVKCRPPNNRRPEPEEINSCLHYLVQEVRTLRPDFILLLGNTPLKTLTMVPDGISRNRGKIPTHAHVFGSPLVYATFHPSAALRSKVWKSAFEADVKTFASLVKVGTPEPALAPS
jgi:uracil-DNA glycosylase family 4